VRASELARTLWAVTGIVTSVVDAVDGSSAGIAMCQIAVFEDR
jgi:hypothetical protein